MRRPITEQEAAEASARPVGLVKKVALETEGEEVLDEVFGLLLAAAGAAEVAIDWLPVAMDEEVEDGSPLQTDTSAQGHELAPMRCREATIGSTALDIGFAAGVWAGRRHHLKVFRPIPIPCSAPRVESFS